MPVVTVTSAADRVTDRADLQRRPGAQSGTVPVPALYAYLQQSTEQNTHLHQGLDEQSPGPRGRTGSAMITWQDKAEVTVAPRVQD